jgi:hypothetical protein
MDGGAAFGGGRAWVRGVKTVHTLAQCGSTQRSGIRLVGVLYNTRSTKVKKKSLDETISVCDVCRGAYHTRTNIVYV